MTTFTRPFAFGLLAVALTAACASSSNGAEQTRDYLYTKFENGDIPTQDQFGTLIDSVLHSIDDRFSLQGIVAAPNGAAAYFDVEQTIDQNRVFGPAAGLSIEWAGKLGFMGVSFLEDSQTHYGYFQLQSGTPGTPDL